ncbi:MAG: winged helix-turn-helix transcriptional regulator [Pseudomonadota bacterium]
MDTLFLVNLCARSWAVTALALIARGTVARTSPLAAAAGCGRTAMTASVEHLVSLGLLEANPGYGHPLRPAYRLTPAGARVAAWAETLDSAVPPAVDRALLRGKWTLAVLHCLDRERRFGELRATLQPVTDRALSASLGRLAAERWVTRQVSTHTAPPSVLYRVRPSHEPLVRQLHRLPAVA